MAHYAFLDDDNIVVEVIPGRDEYDDDVDWEQYYGEFRGLRCKRTSYNTIAGQHTGGGEPFRMNYAGVGFTYDEDRDAFIAPKPFPSWVLDEGTCTWAAPVPHPGDGYYLWNEENREWVLTEIE